MARSGREVQIGDSIIIYYNNKINEIKINYYKYRFIIRKKLSNVCINKLYLI